MSDSDRKRLMGREMGKRRLCPQTGCSERREGEGSGLDSGQFLATLHFFDDVDIISVAHSSSHSL